MQTFAVLFLGILLGPKLAFLTVLLYLFEGLLGLPVFAKEVVIFTLLDQQVGIYLDFF